MEDYSHDPTTAWAVNVLQGRIVAGELVKYAAERHIRDLRDGPARGLHWRPELAAEALGFFPAVLTVTAGAMVGRPFNLLPHHTFLTGSLFGWRRPDGLRRFRTCWQETGKGQAKSPWMAAVGIYLMGFCGISRAEIYAIAGDKDQANVLFRDGVAMCRATIPGSESEETLESSGLFVLRGTGDMCWKIEHPESGSKFQSLANDSSPSGPRPTAVMGDEIHEHKSSHSIEMWSQAIVKMPGDPMMLLGTNTPASDQIVGTDYSNFYQEIVKGNRADDSSLVFIARVDSKDKPFEDETCWPKSLPALGLTFPLENIRNEVTKAQGLASKALAVKRLYFGVPVGSSEYWIDEDLWDASLVPEIDEEEMRGYPCWLGVDLSQRHDLTAVAAVWKRLDEKMFARIWYWKPKEGLADAEASDKAPYGQWVAEGQLTAVPGRTINKSFVVAQVQRLVNKYDVRALAFDIAHFQDFRDAANDIGFETWEYAGPDKPEGVGLKMIRHAQGVAGMHSERQLWMPRSIQNLEDRILDKSLKIQQNAVTTWCAGNAILSQDGAGNRFFDKKRGRGRIDGLVALAQAVGAATAAKPGTVNIDSFLDNLVLV